MNKETKGGATRVEDIPRVIESLCGMYDESVANLRNALARYLKSGERPDATARGEGMFAYPELRIEYRYDPKETIPARSFGRLNHPGSYATSIARPYLFRKYLTEQLIYLIEDYDVEVSVGRSASEIPYPYVLDGTDDLRLDGAQALDLALWFPTTELANIGDELADGEWQQPPGVSRPLSLFDGPRVDFSLARLRHYTGTPPEHTQRYLLFTNYVRYVDEFVRWAVDELNKPDSPYRGLSAAGGVYVTKDTPNPVEQVMEGGWRKHQMPAYHLVATRGEGVSLVNIGVGPANAKTICDHLAVMRPEVWLMIGHCGGLRPSQTIGDYVLAHAYLRDDHVMDDFCQRKSRSGDRRDPKARSTRDGGTARTQSWSGGSGRHRITPTTATGASLHLSARRFNPSRAVAVDMNRRPWPPRLPLPRSLRNLALRLGQPRPRDQLPGINAFYDGDQPSANRTRPALLSAGAALHSRNSALRRARSAEKKAISGLVQRAAAPTVFWARAKSL